MRTLSGLSLALCCLATVTASAAPRIALTPARYWMSGFAAAPRLPIAADVDGDGRADTLCLFPAGDGIVDLSRTSSIGKPRFSTQARTQFGKDGLAVAAGKFDGTDANGVLGVFADGSVRLAHALRADKNGFDRDDLLLVIPAALRLKAPVRAVAADFDGDGKPDVMLIGASGYLILLRNRNEKAGESRFEAIPVEGNIAARQIAAGDLDGGGKASLVWVRPGGEVRRAFLTLEPDKPARLSASTLIVKAAPKTGLAVGRFRGEKAADILIGQSLLPGGDPAKAQLISTLPPTAEGDLTWIAADFDGDGKDDLLRVRRSKERFSGDDLLIHYARDIPEGATTADTAVAPADADNDGLPDDWETGQIKPAGLDLAALGCSPRHRDVIVEVQPITGVSQEVVKREMERVVKFYAALPIDNPDGVKGIVLHVIYREPIPQSDAGQPWWALGDKYFPSSHRGITHWMVIYGGGGGQSDEMADRGSCGVNALYATFLHEFGHQLGLDHTGRWSPVWCPIYPSLMNYAYSYQLNGKGENIGYSDGRLASLVLRERHLSEKIPLPMDKVAFLAGPPYRYRMKPTKDGKGTLIDWNWNGKFGEENVVADINYGYSTSGGLRHTIGKTYSAPVVVSCGEGDAGALLLFGTRLAMGTPVPPADGTAKLPSVSPEQPGSLYLRIWRGKNPAADGPNWSNEQDVDASGVTGDPSAVSLFGVVWVAYPTKAGVVLRRAIVSDSGNAAIGNPIPVPGTEKALPTLAVFAGRLVLLLWRDASTPIGLRMSAVRGETPEIGPETPLGFTSGVPVGAVEGANIGKAPSLWIGLTQDQEGGKTFRWQVRRFALEAGGALAETQQEWIGGEKGGERGDSRIMLLLERDPAFGKEGRLYFLCTGLYGKESPWACHYVATRIADKSINGGWLTRRYYDEWTQSRSAPGVCWFRGEMIFASRWFGNVHGTENDNLFVAFYGRGIEDEPMGDFDDIGLIRDYGMRGSIAHAGE